LGRLHFEVRVGLVDLVDHIFDNLVRNVVHVGATSLLEQGECGVNV
jgi:hypothetical protein